MAKRNIPINHISNNVIISPVDSARNLGVIFDKNLTFSDHISAVSISCFYHIRYCKTIDHNTACNIATSLIHF